MGKYKIFYICQNCNESNTTSNGGKSHKCPKAKTIQTTQLVDILPTNLKKDESPEFQNAIEPHLKTIRWDSLYKCVKFITENKKSFFGKSDNIVIIHCFDEIGKKTLGTFQKKKY